MEPPSIERMGRQQRRQQQHALLQTALKRMLRSAVWQARLPDGVTQDLRSVEDLATLPFTVKDDLRPPLAMVIVPRRALVRVHASSGSGGAPTVVAYTAGDLTLWAALVARGLAAVGVGPDSVVHSALGYGLFTAASASMPQQSGSGRP